jgi:hypothetical protein
MPQRIITISCWPPLSRTTGAGKSGKTPGIGGRLPTWWLITRNRAMIAAWFVVIE